MPITRQERKKTSMPESTVRDTFVRIKRIDEEKQIVSGEVYAPYQLDTFQEFMTPEDIELMAHRFMKLDLSKSIDTHHDNVPNNSYPVESFIARKGDPEYTEGAWVLSVKIPDEKTWLAVKSGDINGFSFQSMVVPQEMDVTYLVMRDHVGETESAIGHEHVFFVQLDETGKVIGGYTNEVSGHSHMIKRASITEICSDHTHRFFL